MIAPERKPGMYKMVIDSELKPEPKPVRSGGFTPLSVKGHSIGADMKLRGIEPFIDGNYWKDPWTKYTRSDPDNPNSWKLGYTPEEDEDLSAYCDHDFERAVRGIFREEGGYKGYTKKTRDPETHYGVTQGFINEAVRLGVKNAGMLSVKNLTPRQAARLYEEVLWRRKLRATELDKSNPDLMDLLLDTAVNFGYPKTGIMLNKILLGKNKQISITNETVKAFNDTKDKWLLYKQLLDMRKAARGNSEAYSRGWNARDMRFQKRLKAEWPLAEPMKTERNYPLAEV